MKNAQFVDDKRKYPKLIAFRCPCGLSGNCYVTGGKMLFECPDPECGEMYEVVRLGRRRQAAVVTGPVVPPPALRLA